MPAIVRPDKRRYKSPITHSPDTDDAMDDTDDAIPISVHDPVLPDVIREAILPIWQEGFVIYEYYASTGTEWWLFDGDGNLLDAFWLE